MAIHAHPKVATLWDKIVRQAEKTGKAPFPIVDTVTFDPDGIPAISLLAPGVVDDSPVVFVDVNGMLPADEVALRSLLNVLQGLIQIANVAAPGQSGLFIGAEPAEFWGIYHAGGLNYEFYGPHTTVIQLAHLDQGLQRVIWGLLRSVALLGSQYPNREASIARSCLRQP